MVHHITFLDLTQYLTYPNLTLILYMTWHYTLHHKKLKYIDGALHCMS